MGSSVRSMMFAGLGLSTFVAALTLSMTLLQMFQTGISPSFQGSVFQHHSVSMGLLQVAPPESTLSGTEVLHALDDLLKQGVSLSVDTIPLSMESDIEKQDVSFIKPGQTYKLLVTRDAWGNLTKVSFLGIGRGERP
ncbi:hypothetical protein [Paenibacillus larvae]|uniref:Uncharacterized protein n=1 Tax=Paenibacillus larvae subsp. larvae TaxID=147375 RepID=A0A6C0QW80_9BACL|nr:hypothetical protein [Paenibacillus larvae]QHZ52476.1 hypothetical protein ERICV_03365 [Paenibacillus larvae subsp. larvae]